MPTRTSYVQGTPSWVDLQTSDLEGAKAFYASLFGWNIEDSPIPGGGVYSMAFKNGQTAAGMALQSPELAARGVPVMWNTYLAVDDADAALARVGASGGQVAMPAMDVMDAGRMAFALDPTGAAVGLWQAKDHIGAGIVNEPGALIWNELVTADKDAAVGFYESVFGLQGEDVDMGGQAYTLFKANGEMVAGLTAPQMAGVPNHWGVYFAVQDIVSSLQTVGELGGSVVVDTFETPIGKMAVARDPQGGFFSLYEPNAQTS